MKLKLGPSKIDSVEPGTKILETLVKTMVSLTQTEKGEWGPKSMGQNGAETHLGTIIVPMDRHTNKCLITRGRRDTGETS